jgi:Aspartyl protease
MNMWRNTLAIMLVLSATRGIAQHPDSLMPPGIEMPADGLRVPMASLGGRSIVEARVNGHGPYRFYFDSGASGAVISLALAKELKLPTTGQAGVRSGGDDPEKKPLMAEVVRIDRLELGTAKLSSVMLVALDRARLGTRDAPAGVLSAALFPGYLVTWDYSKKEVRVRAGELPVADNKTIFDYLAGHPIPAIPLKIGDETVDAHLDSGSGAGLSLPMKLAKTLPLYAKPVDTGKKARSVSGDFPVFQAKLKGRCSFGEYVLTDPTIDFSDVVRNGNLGSGILRRFVLTLDVKNRRFQLIEAK